VLHRLAELDGMLVRRAVRRATTSSASPSALNFCANVDLSAFYFDIRKDALYCDAAGQRCAAAAARTVMGTSMSRRNT
jgi:isoleucyl-tRNA synthetase